MPPLLRVEGLSIERPDGRVLLRDTALELRAAELVLLVGPSGSGKSTLMLLLGGLLGQGVGGWGAAGWTVRGRMFCGGQERDLSRLGGGVGGVVFQDHALFDDLDAQENLRIALDHAPPRGAEAGLAERVGGLLSGIDPGQTVGSCSGGQRQRLAIARTVLADQPVLLFDEPNSGLDIAASRRLIGLVRDLCRELGKPALITVHHFQDLLPLADRVLLLDPHGKRLVAMDADPALIEAALHDAAGPEPAGASVAPERSWRLGGRTASRGFWFARYFAGYAWSLCAAPTMLLYLGGGAVIVGFVTVWFGFNYYSFEGYLKSLLHDDTLTGLGMVQARVAIPLLASILFVARNSAVIAADVGNRVLSSQFRAMDNLNIPGRAYVFGAILLSMTGGCVVFVVLSVLVGGWAAQETWHLQFPTQYRALFKAQFFREVLDPAGLPLPVMAWVPVKAAASGLLAGAVALLIGAGPKASSQAVGRAVANAIVLGVLLTLVVHAAISILIT